MTERIDWLRKLDWVQWLALVALLCAYAVIAMPFLGVPWKRAEEFAILAMFCSAILLLAESRGRRAARSGPSGFSHLGGVAMVMMILWGQPWWSVPCPQQAADFQVFVWPFLILVNATRILSAQATDRDDAVLEREPGLA